jgi:hypothetical protein
MAVTALIDKLIKAGAAANDEGTITFTPQFAGYLIWTVGTSQVLDSTVGDWRNILAMFNPSLGHLSPDEIVDTVLLFEYYLHHPDLPAIAN